MLAIDPGNVQSAFVVFEPMGATGYIMSSGIVSNQDMLALCEEGFPDCCPDWMAIEMVESFGMAVGKEIFETVWWTGRFCQAWDNEDVQHTRVYRKEVKLHLCGSPRAKDGNIRQALLDRLGPQGRKSQPGPTYGISKDMWSALAVAVTWHDLHSKEVRQCL